VVEAFGDLRPTVVDVDDLGFDLGAYRAAGSAIAEPYVCFLNSNSEILGDHWLRKLWTNLAAPQVGMVSATGSFESMNERNPEFPAFPNVHLRSNAFLISRTMFLELTDGRTVATKDDVWRMESGNEGMTRQIQRRGLGVAVVGRNGRGYAPRWWPLSGTFRLGRQDNLLIGDNQTRWFAALPGDQKSAIVQHTWGRFPQAMQSAAVMRRLRRQVP